MTGIQQECESARKSGFKGGHLGHCLSPKSILVGKRKLWNQKFGTAKMSENSWKEGLQQLLC